MPTIILFSGSVPAEAPPTDQLAGEEAMEVTETPQDTNEQGKPQVSPLEDHSL